MKKDCRKIYRIRGEMSENCRMTVEIQRRGRADKTKRKRERKNRFWGNAQNAGCQEKIFENIYGLDTEKNIKYLDKNMENMYNGDN